MGRKNSKMTSTNYEKKCCFFCHLPHQFAACSQHDMPTDFLKNGMNIN